MLAREPGKAITPEECIKTRSVYLLLGIGRLVGMAIPRSGLASSSAFGSMVAVRLGHPLALAAYWPVANLRRS